MFNTFLDPCLTYFTSAYGIRNDMIAVFILPVDAEPVPYRRMFSIGMGHA